MDCKKCEGKGWVDNQRYYNMSACIAWERGIEPRKKCSECKGTGYVIGHVKDVLDFLKSINPIQPRINMKDLQRAIDVIEKY